jgi:ergothioneine biosynthesis protein EgtB
MPTTAVRSTDLDREAFLALPLAEQYRTVRAFTEALTEPLATEDFVVQSHADVSPTKWHLAHTTWFWETFVLAEFLDGYELHDERYPFLFNSYYVQAGERHFRAQRGYLSRPTVKEVFAFRAHVDEAMQRLLQGIPGDADSPLAEVVRVGLNHEQQHQELMLTDIKHVFSVNPLRPTYRRPPRSSGERVPTPEPAPLRWVTFEEGLHEVGYLPERDGPFTFDNETPRHRVFLEPFALADRLVTCGEFMAFMEDDGYERAPLWLSEGFATVQENEWTEPFYWEQRDGVWHHFTLHGMQPVDPSEPLTHVSYFEADAYARWAGARLPTEFEWEVASEGAPVAGHFAEDGVAGDAPLHPTAPEPATEPATAGDGAPASDGAPRLSQLFGTVWEWTRSQYSPYPGYQPAPGALGEYNGKFMCNQFVLRGGSCATSRTHIRRTYRNFFAPASTWQFTGIRLAKDP